MSELISVIIPAYNVAPYIGKCLESVLAQTYRALEVIVINDGSTDATPKVIERFLDDKRILYIDQPNSGVTAARNAGIAAATGKYLTFVDSDDWIESEMYDVLHRAITSANADVAVCNYNLIYNDHTEYCYSAMQRETIDIAADATRYFYKYCACAKPNNYIWVRLYQSHIVKTTGLCFEEHKLGDDTLFNFKLLPFIRRIVHIPDGFYNYLQRTNSNVYTVAQKCNLAKVYADAFESLKNHYVQRRFDAYRQILPIHAFTRMRSILYYSQLAGLDEQAIVNSIAEGFKGMSIAAYLRDTDEIDAYAQVNGLSSEYAKKIKRVMYIAVDDPQKLVGMMSL